MIERLKWFIAGWMSDHYEDVCWGDCVGWVVGFSPWLEYRWRFWDLRHTAGTCARMGCRPYCGKCAEAK